ncbi:hypothetical protein [Neorhizobium sp. JUb45]|uniref:hypothetical protein n=1 Tax=unclassified Neorhizobium TaxID=2629175 RepID=UPI001051DB91|nr:hypothetical protein [Neorhizobium sp. JUb45]TCQ95365.1 hypothetical protein EDF70_12413 [Neorhizobium sp. JUb45]
MVSEDEAAVWLAAGVLRSGKFDIEAVTLEAMAADAPAGGLDTALKASEKSDVRGGALGMEILGAIVVPVLVEAAKQFWASYQKELIEKTGKSAADATLVAIKKWFFGAPPEDKSLISQKLANAITLAGEARKMKVADIEALIAATAPERLEAALAKT